MMKKEFMKILKQGLKGLPREEIDSIMADYEEHFAVGLSKKKKDTTIAKSLGDPKKIAKQHKVEFVVKKAEEQKSPKNLMRAIFATIGMGFFNLVIISGPFFAFLSVLIAFFASGVAIIASGIAVLVASIVAPSVGFIELSAVSIIGVVFAGLGIAALGILFLIGTVYLWKWFAKLTIMYLKFNIRIIKGK